MLATKRNVNLKEVQCSAVVQRVVKSVLKKVFVYTEESREQSNLVRVISQAVDQVTMGLLDKLWDDVVAGPQPEKGLGKLRQKQAALPEGGFWFPLR